MKLLEKIDMLISRPGRVDEYTGTSKRYGKPTWQGDYGKKPNSNMLIKCMECGKKFRKAVGKNTFEIKCPGCGGFDTEPMG